MKKRVWRDLLLGVVRIEMVVMSVFDVLREEGLEGGIIFRIGMRREW